jgi:hypothetical protein
MLVPRGPLRALGELVGGIVWTSSVQLTNAARRWAPNPRALARAVERLSDHLSDVHFDHHPWAAQALRQLCGPLADDDLIPIDMTDLAKPYARVMDLLCLVQDASRPGKPVVPGYWCLGAYRCRPDGQMLHPLLLAPWSSTLPGWKSENDVIDRKLWQLKQATGGRGIWLMDRGGDRPEVFASFLRLQPRWIIRLREDRPLIGPGGLRQAAGVWADEALATRSERGRAVTLPVHLPPEDLPAGGPVTQLWLVVPTYGFWHRGRFERWVLLTCGLIGHQHGPRQVRHHYGHRWRSEDAKRFLGQIWHVERFLTRSWPALERMLTCVALAGGFLAELEAHEPALAQRLCGEVMYLPDAEEPEVPCYRLARGIQTLAWRHGPPTMVVNA